MKRDLIISIFISVVISMLVGNISVYAVSYLYNANEISYSNTSSGISSDNVQGAIDELYTAAQQHATMETRVEKLEADSNIIIKECRYDNKPVAADGSTYFTCSLPSGCSSSSIYSVDLVLAWPKNSWTNGAVLKLNVVQNDSFRFTTTSAQNYDIIIRLSCKYR